MNLKFNLNVLSLTAKCSRLAPTAAKVANLIEAEGWTANYPRPEDVLAKWRPLTRAQAQSDPTIIKGVTQQKWSGLAVKDFGEQKGMYQCLMSTVKSIEIKKIIIALWTAHLMTPLFDNRGCCNQGLREGLHPV